MDKQLEKLEVACQEDKNDTISLEDYPPDKQALVSISLWTTSELFFSVEDAKKMRDWWIAFCEKYENNDFLQQSSAQTIEDQILRSIVDQLPDDLENLHQECPIEFLNKVRKET